MEHINPQNFVRDHFRLPQAYILTRMSEAERTAYLTKCVEKWSQQVQITDVPGFVQGVIKLLESSPIETLYFSRLSEQVLNQFPTLMHAEHDKVIAALAKFLVAERLNNEDLERLYHYMLKPQRQSSPTPIIDPADLF